MQTAIFSSEARHSAFGLFGDPEVGQGLLSSDFLLRLLDEIDYGLVLVAADGRICHANHLARHELASARLIATYDECIIGCSAELTAQLQAAIEGAHQGRRKLLYLAHGGHNLPVALIPLAHPLEGDAPAVLLVMARQRVGQSLALPMFARVHGLTPTEESVLRGLCEGMEVDEIAAEHGVAESTVRTQVRSLRDKTGAGGIRQLVQRVMALPPVVPALRTGRPLAG
ncbi:helix-turn-helix transcriptional regulator [Ottowia sp.]|uniref:helix-turn-helix transcriptional regulator n=1 Tax=Ottowia sp. TaxID=1898956 RepID=UPI001D82ADB1|nr:helix-turn-helix transcriptional regulator [Ottowia sp.]MCO5117816.1 helix-turn-helix transcriptional regulator [Burkholderiaceae bacterium]MCB2024681.1 helix-turn-helix transcriptional regulator [Ottowia sp.]MCB2037047.1 helix-turn-helix transcriptional regulator [Ottowia sp.]MCP5256543.1 helix-turn-helix transcriptional regulator [Burkholderiaceae bacterium]HPK33448.1 helix-turn-helix transcriptional regulator [Ottowia sp.]